MRLLLLLMLLCTSNLFAQVLNPCGTPPEKEDWLVQYQRNPTMFRTDPNVVNYLPLSLHIMGTNTGTGYISWGNLLDGLCTLNRDYAPYDIQYYLFDEPHYANNNAWYNHATVVDGAYMMFANNIDSVINVYFCQNVAGNAGYNLPYAGAAIANGYMSGGTHTIAHELGHCLSLPHPFLGWEGKTYNYSTPTPLRVTYDYTHFKDSFVISPTIIDTAEVEYVDRRNCHTAADGFCDTPSDYLSYRWACNLVDSSSTLQQKDPDSINFHSDGSLFMSYSYDECSGRFSPEQVGAMRACIHHKRAYLLNHPAPNVVAINGTAQPIAPANGTSEPNDGSVTFAWSSVPGATHYVFQFAWTPSNFTQGTLHLEVVTTDTFYTVTENLPVRPGTAPPYAWRVRPFNSTYFCAPFSAQQTFTTSTPTGVTSLNLNPANVRVYPNLLTAGSDAQIEVNATQATQMQAMLVDISGKVIWKENYNTSVGTNLFTVPTHPLVAGLYFLQLQTADGASYREKLVVM